MYSSAPAAVTLLVILGIVGLAVLGVTLIMHGGDLVVVLTETPSPSPLPSS